MNTLTFNGHTSDEFGIRIEKMPALNRPARKFRFASVPGRNGNIYEMEDAWEEIIVPYEIFAGGMNDGAAVASFTEIMEWLHSANGYAVLSDTYDLEHYRMAVFVDSADIESQWHTWGRTVINFRCRPEHYLTNQTQAVASGAVINNTTNHIAKPLITLTGGGVMSLLRFGNSRTKYTNANMPYTTGELNNLIAVKDADYFVADVYDEAVEYTLPSGVTVASWLRLDSVATATTLNDTYGTLEYTTSDSNYNWGIGLCLAVTSGEYTVSWEADNKSKVRVLYAGKTGYNTVQGIAYAETNASGWTAQSLTFNVPDDCGYILLHFGRQDKADTIPKFRKIMLNPGAVAQPFYGYTVLPYSTLTINDTSMKIIGGFGTVVIDCEKEDVSIDGANGNRYASIKDQYGNISENFFRFVKGNNTITYDNEISAVTVDTRFWNL